VLTRSASDSVHLVGLLYPETIAALKRALEQQAVAGVQPTLELTDALHQASREARERQLLPEALIIQLKALADDVGLPLADVDSRGPRVIREWMITACLRAYWNVES
jgi:hypothetical protein